MKTTPNEKRAEKVAGLFQFTTNKHKPEGTRLDIKAFEQMLLFVK